MSPRFESKKRSILEKLAQPDEEYTDASPKGTVDSGIRSFVDEINATAGYVTTSSCAGRVAIYFDGEANDDANKSMLSASGGKGSGKWLYTSHSRVLVQDDLAVGEMFKMCGLPHDAAVSFPKAGTCPRFVHFKFEPMILHILCISLQAAQAVLSAALQSGFRESGISSLGDANDEQATAMVAVRSAGLSFDSIVAFQDEKGCVVPMVEEQHLHSLMALANERFAKNEIRKDRFREALQIHATKVRSKSHDNRPHELVHIKERNQGIKKKDLIAQRKALATGNPGRS